MSMGGWPWLLYVNYLSAVWSTQLTLTSSVDNSAYLCLESIMNVDNNQVRGGWRRAGDEETIATGL